MALAYIDEDGLRQRFGDGEIDGLTQTTTGEDALARCAEDAQALVDGYIGKVVSLPLSAVPLLVSNWAADIARFKLWDQRAPLEVRQRYDDALAQLKLVAQGVISIGPLPNATPVPLVAFASYGPERIFTADTLAGY